MGKKVYYNTESFSGRYCCAIPAMTDWQRYEIFDAWVCDPFGNIHPGYNASPIPVHRDSLEELVFPLLHIDDENTLWIFADPEDTEDALGIWEILEPIVCNSDWEIVPAYQPDGFCAGLVDEDVLILSRDTMLNKWGTYTFVGQAYYDRDHAIISPIERLKRDGYFILFPHTFMERE